LRGGTGITPSHFEKRGKKKKRGGKREGGDFKLDYSFQRDGGTGPRGELRHPRATTNFILKEERGKPRKAYLFPQREKAGPREKSINHT